MTDNDIEIKRAMAIKIKALLAKTTEAGCSEQEALAAAHKAHELLAKYQLSLSDLDLREEGTSESQVPIDPNVKALAAMVANYCDCKVWSEPSRGKMNFLGLKSDAFFAEWLSLALASFVARKTLDYALGQDQAFMQDSIDFSSGCCRRINERLREEIEQRERDRVNNTGRALMIVKGQLITEAWAKKNLTLRPGNWQQNNVRASAAYSAGHQAGSEARFARPVARDEFETKSIGGPKR